MVKRKELLKALTGTGVAVALSCLAKAEATPPTPSLTITKYSLKGAYDVKVEKIGNEIVAIDKEGEVIEVSDYLKVPLEKAFDYGKLIFIASGEYDLNG